MGRGKGGGAGRHAFDAADPAALKAIYYVNASSFYQGCQLEPIMSLL